MDKTASDEELLEAMEEETSSENIFNFCFCENRKIVIPCNLPLLSNISYCTVNG